MKMRLPDYSLAQYTQPRQRHQFLVLYFLPTGLYTNFNNISKDTLKRIRAKYEPDGNTILNTIGQPYTREPVIPGISSDVQDFLTLSTQSIQDVNWQVSNQTDEQFYNQRIHWGGKRIYDDNIQIQFREYVESPVTRLLLMWQRLVNDPVTNNHGYAQDYKGKIIKLEFDPNIMKEQTIEKLLTKFKSDFFQLTTEDSKVITRQVIFEGVWPSSIPEMGGQYNEDTLVTFTQQFTVDRYFEDNDWVRYLSTPDNIVSEIIRPK